MSEKKTNKPPVAEPAGEKKKGDLHINLNLNDLVGFGVRMVKSGLSMTRSIEEVIDRKLDELVAKGSCSRAEASQTAENLKKQLNQGISKFSGRLGDGVRATLNRMNIATINDLKSMEERLDKILKETESINKTNKAASESKSRIKSAPKARKGSTKSPARKKTSDAKPAV